MCMIINLNKHYYESNFIYKSSKVKDWQSIGDQLDDDKWPVHMQKIGLA